MDLQTEHIAKYHKRKWMQKKEIQSRGKFHSTHYFDKHWKMLKFATKFKIKLTLMEKSIGFGTRWPTSNITYTDRRFIIFCISMPWYRVSMLTNKHAKKQTNIWSEFHDCFFSLGMIDIVILVEDNFNQFHSSLPSTRMPLVGTFWKCQNLAFSHCANKTTAEWSVSQ